MRLLQIQGILSIQSVFKIIKKFFKDANSLNGRLCFLMEIAFKQKRGWDSGRKFCKTETESVTTPEPEPLYRCTLSNSSNHLFMDNSELLTSTEKTYNFSLWGSPACRLRLLLIGGGGQGGDVGGGSGFVEYRSIEIPTGETVITAKVGAPQESSTVSFPDSTITAESGGDGGLWKGSEDFAWLQNLVI